MKNITLKAIPLIIALFIATPSAFAAKYYLSDNNDLIKGCSGTIAIMIDTEGAGVMAGDSTLLISSGAVKVNQLSIGPSLPMQIFSQISGDSIKLSGARLPLSGSFKGVGTFGYINFTPSETANSATFTFAPDFNYDNNIIDENIDNVLTQAVSKTYTFKDPYNKGLDGTGFCSPDVTPPSIQFVAPVSGSGNVPVNANVIFALSDNRAGVDINSLKFSIDKINYTKNSSQVSVKQDGGVYRIETNPDNDFTEGSNVIVRVDVCDLNVPANCATGSASFRVYTPAPPPAVCGDGIVNYGAGEQCDDGNTISGDGCSSLCLFETPPPPFTRGESCTDGLHNQGEYGIDCGGPCPNPCPTCVDGIKNQGEEGVDCGGPCPPCGETPALVCPVLPESEKIIICHYPPGRPDKPQTIEVYKDSWPAHQALGATLGPCQVFDICAEALLFAAPEREREAIENATLLIQEKGVLEQQKSVITAPTVITEVISQIDICKANPAYATADFDSSSADTDGDGLSDRMECYAGTDPLNPDTDGDGCSDFDELNIFFTDPNDGTDCTMQDDTEVFSDIFITDPQPGWILSSRQPVVSGKVPESTVLVLVVATQAEQARVTGLLKALEGLFKLSDASSPNEINEAISQYSDQYERAITFLDASGKDFNSDAFVAVMKSAPTDLYAGNVLSNETKKDLEAMNTKLSELKAKPIVATASTQLKNTKVGEFDAKNFEEISNPLQDRQVYDLVATAYLADGSQVSSRAVRFSLDIANTIHKPIPRTIGGELITEATAFDNLFIGGKAYAQDGSGRPEILIVDERPTVTGETEFGSQVFAIWNSLVLASSAISDSEQGAFEVQAPRNLEVGIPHRVTLYAVKTEDNNKIRSESVDVFFRIKAPKEGMWPVAVFASTTIFLAVIAIVARRIFLRRSAMRLFKKK